jgi:hypothetical protein
MIENANAALLSLPLGVLLSILYGERLCTVRPWCTVLAPHVHSDKALHARKCVEVRVLYVSGRKGKMKEASNLVSMRVGKSFPVGCRRSVVFTLVGSRRPLVLKSV